MVSLRLPPALVRRLDAWRQRQTVPPLRTTVIIHAIEQFLDEVEKSDSGKGPR